MDKKVYLHSKPFMKRLLKDEQGHHTGIEWDEELFNKVDRLTEELCDKVEVLAEKKWLDSEKRIAKITGNVQESKQKSLLKQESLTNAREKAYREIMDAFIVAYPRVKEVDLWRTLVSSEDVKAIDYISDLHSKAKSDIRKPVESGNADAIRLAIKENRLIGISVSAYRTTNELYADLTLPEDDERRKYDDSYYIRVADFDLYNDEELKWMLGAKGATIEVTPTDKDFPAVSKFVVKSLYREEDEVLRNKNIDKRLYEPMLKFFKAIRKHRIRRSDALDYIENVMAIGKIDRSRFGK